MFDALLPGLHEGASRFGELILLFVLPFVREDVAVVTGSLLIVEHRLPAQLALASLYAGIVASDFTLFGLGRLARRSARVRRLLLRPHAERLAGWLLDHAVAAMVLARVLPGLIFPVYVGFGLAGGRVRLFAPVTMLTAALYLPALLWLVTRFGEEVLSRAGYWAWLVAIVLLVVVVGWVRNPPWGMLLRVGRSGLRSAFARDRGAVERREVSHRGMPSLRTLTAQIGRAERVPQKLFYLPLALQWIGLALRYRSLTLPTLANPLIEVGGLWGESKTVCLDMVAEAQRRWLARYVTMTRGAGVPAADDAARAADLARAAGIGFPLVAKPDIGWQGYGVRPVATAAALQAYVADFPEGAALMLQELVGWEGEAGVFYARMPDEERGRVIALTLRYFPHVVGDGTRAVRDLILADQRASLKAGAHLGLQGKHGGLSPQELDRVPAAGEVVRLAFIGSVRVGGLYRDAHEHITDTLSDRFDAISRAMPRFHYGRYDVRFASIERLREGEDFRIIEINGAGGEAISVWDPEMPLRAVYARLFAHQRMLFAIGAQNRALGFRPSGPAAVVRAALRQGRLVSRYPPSS